MRLFSEHKNAFWLSLVFAMSLTCAPMLSHAAQQDALPPLPNSAQPGSPLPPLPHLDPDQRNAQRTIPGAYRLTYTLTEMDGNKRVGSHRYEIVLDAGHDVPPARLSLGTKVPVETGGLQGNSTSQSISYIDVGLIIEASLQQFANGLELRSHVIQSAVDSQQGLPKTPVIRQTDFSSAVLLNEGKSLTIGNVDMPGTTHVLQIQVELSKLP